MFIFVIGNNLYGWTMSRCVTYGGFEWLEPILDELDESTKTSDIGQVYEVNISYPEHLHDDHSDLPFLPNNAIPPDFKVENKKQLYHTQPQFETGYS